MGDGGAIPTPEEAAMRFGVALFSTLLLFLGFFWVIWDAKHEAWHDKIAATKVIKIG